MYQELVDAVSKCSWMFYGLTQTFSRDQLALACAALVAAGDALTSAVTRETAPLPEQRVFSDLIGAVAQGKA